MFDSLDTDRGGGLGGRQRHANRRPIGPNRRRKLRGDDARAGDRNDQGAPAGAIGAEPAETVKKDENKQKLTNFENF